MINLNSQGINSFDPTTLLSALSFSKYCADDLNIVVLQKTGNTSFAQAAESSSWFNLTDFSDWSMVYNSYPQSIVPFTQASSTTQTTGNHGVLMFPGLNIILFNSSLLCTDDFAHYGARTLAVCPAYGSVATKAFTNISPYLLTTTILQNDLSAYYQSISGISTHNITDATPRLLSLKYQIDYKELSEFRRFYVTDWEQGGISDASGGNLSRTNQIRLVSNKKIWVEANKEYIVKVNSNYKVIPKFWAKTIDETTGAVSYSYTQIPDESSVWHESPDSIIAPSDGYFRFVVSLIDNSELSPEASSEIGFTLSSSDGTPLISDSLNSLSFRGAQLILINVDPLHRRNI